MLASMVITCAGMVCAEASTAGKVKLLREDNRIDIGGRGKEILKKAGIETLDTMEEGARMAVKLAGRN